MTVYKLSKISFRINLILFLILLIIMLLTSLLIYVKIFISYFKILWTIMHSYINHIFFPRDNFISPKIGQICWREIETLKSEIKKFRLTAEIVNMNYNVGLYKAFVQVIGLDKEGSKINPSFAEDEGDFIPYLPPNSKYIFVCDLYGRKQLDDVYFVFQNTKWRDFSNISSPKAVIIYDLLYTIFQEYNLEFIIENLSKYKHRFQINCGFYNKNGRLIGGVKGNTIQPIKPGKRKYMILDVPFDLPVDCRYEIQVYKDNVSNLYRHNNLIN